MKTSEKKDITDIVNAFRLINSDIRTVFNLMSEKLNSVSSFKNWKKYEKQIRPTIEGYRDWDELIKGNDNWYYLNCYGEYKKKIIGFTFVISINYDEKTDVEYSDFIDNLDTNINKNTPLLCISGVYSLIDNNIKKAKFLKDDEWSYVDDILQFTGDWKNYKPDNISYNQWINVEMDYEKANNRFDGWYKEAFVNIVNITDISSKEKADTIIDELILQAKQT
ncbi:hypothetical protein MNB_SM-5-468 [hydrothermal vent metagenome]|uniref:Uncharacterized protein n=1 Tax=hydrothermal vent metagenome TaxID=652676 RepID=A0A1W1CYI3_9ZZZZ